MPRPARVVETPGWLDVHCYQCQRKIAEIEPGGRGKMLKTCPRCKARNLVDVASGKSTR